MAKEFDVYMRSHLTSADITLYVLTLMLSARAKSTIALSVSRLSGMAKKNVYTEVKTNPEANVTATHKLLSQKTGFRFCPMVSKASAFALRMAHADENRLSISVSAKARVGHWRLLHEMDSHSLIDYDIMELSDLDVVFE